MKRPILMAVGIVAALAFVGQASAAGLQDQIQNCLEKHANTSQAAAITLECTAADGKLSACKVVDSNAPSKGFEAAAVCVAQVLPVGGKTGVIRVPLRFPGQG
jgi:hypothetical protein